MASNKLSLLALFFLPLLICAEQQGSETRLAEARQCRIERLSASRPSRRIESEGGITELWDELQDEFQCTGVGAMRNILQPNSLSLPNYSPAPRLVYIERGEGLVGIAFPGCQETYHSRGQSAHAGSGSKGDERISDKHQKVHRIRKGDIVALPPGVAHWCYNDGNEELVAMSVADLNSQSNQLDQRFRSIYLAGAQSREASYGGQRPQEQEREQPFGESILRGFDPNLIADSLNIPVDLARKLQRGNQRGLIVKVQREGMSLIQPEEEGEERNQIPSRDGIEEERYCSMSIRHNVDNTREADIFTRQGGRLNIVDRFKLPILKHLDMSAERGSIFPNAMFVPHWSVNGHSILYVLRGEGQFQVSDNRGRLVFNGRVKEGDLIPIPQNFVSMKKAGSNGIEWIVFKTTSQPSSEAAVGSSSVFRGMPLQVVANSYRISNKEAQDLKYNRAEHVLIVPPPTS